LRRKIYHLRGCSSNWEHVVLGMPNQWCHFQAAWSMV
jgi:hypothetical protein